jgi:ribosomal protein L15E
VAEQDHVEETNHDEATEFARRILTLETWDREIICRRLAGESLSDIARQLGLVFSKRITVQAVSFRVKRLVKKYRILEVMLVSDKRKGAK